MAAPKTSAQNEYRDMSSAELETRRAELQQKKDIILDNMHAIVREQERRIKAKAVTEMLDKMPPAERNALLDEMKAK